MFNKKILISLTCFPCIIFYFVVQERLTKQIATAIFEALKPAGVAVVIEAALVLLISLVTHIYIQYNGLHKFLTLLNLFLFYSGTIWKYYITLRFVSFDLDHISYIRSSCMFFIVIQILIKTKSMYLFVIMRFLRAIP